MLQSSPFSSSGRILSRLAAAVAARWLTLSVLLWVAASGVLLTQKWRAIIWFGLGDTDDNIRFDQVRDWLAGQGWYDLRQYRLDPPLGANIHWSRLVDLPIAGLILLTRPLFGPWVAYRVAVAVAPLLPLLVAMVALTLVVRRLVSPLAYPLAIALLWCAGSAMLMWTPLRIDHHGWQLALLMVTLAGLTDPAPRRAGATVALASALSLAIGLEMLPYVVFAGAAIGLRWVGDPTREGAVRLRAYGGALALSTALAFLLFASRDNWATRCDALTPVWLTTVVLAAALLVGLSGVRAAPAARLGLLAAAGGATGLAYALLFPQCWGHRLENIPPEAVQLWLSHVREARPIWMHSRDVAIPVSALPAIGAICGAALLWLRRGQRDWAAWVPIVGFGLFAAALTLWQFRTAPSAQMLAVPAATWAAFRVGERAFRRRRPSEALVVSAIAALLVSGLPVASVEALFPAKPKTPVRRGPDGKPLPNATALANRRCPTIPALRPISLLPRGTVLTFVDAGPRLITLTHHAAIAGPYHRNAAAILDVEHAFRGTPEQAHAIVARHHATYVLICPNMSESTIYRSEAPHGFYAMLARGWTPDWLDRVPLPAHSPWVMWRVRDVPDGAAR